MIDLLVFERPISTATYIDLDLPAENYGSDGTVRFRLPLEYVKGSGAKAADLKLELPSNISVADIDPSDSRPLAVRRAAKSRQMVAKFRADLSAFNGPESQREQISNGIQRWEAQVASDLSALEEAKALSITQSKKDLQEQAEKTWPLPKKHTLAERAKIESKWTTWVNQEWEMAKKELMKIYSLD